MRMVRILQPNQFHFADSIVYSIRMAHITIQQSGHHRPYRVLASDLNRYGFMHGGRLLTVCDEVGYIAARSHANGDCLTRAVHQARFHSAIQEGEKLTIRARVGLTGSSSLWVFVEVGSGEHQQCRMDAVFVFVAIDEHRKPRHVPAIHADSDADKQLQARLRHMREQVSGQE